MDTGGRLRLSEIMTDSLTETAGTNFAWAGVSATGANTIWATWGRADSESERIDDLDDGAVKGFSTAGSRGTLMLSAMEAYETFEACEAFEAVDIDEADVVLREQGASPSS